MSSANQDQIDFWNGDAGQQWVADQTYLDRLLEPLSQRVLEAAAPQTSDRVLDVGCGCGTTTLRLSERCAAITGVDVSGPMIARAREQAAGRAKLTFALADASAWQGDAPFDLAFSRFGVMFFAEPIAAFANIRRNLCSDGRLCFICWRAPGDNPWLSIPGAAAAPFLPEAAPVDGPNPFAFADTGFVSNVLTGAGFAEPEFTQCDAQLNLGQSVADAIGFLTRIGPLARVIAELDERKATAALTAVSSALSAYESADGLLLGASCWIVRAPVASA